MKREVTAALLTASNHFTVGMYSDVYESICFKLSTMIDTVDIYILVLI